MGEVGSLCGFSSVDSVEAVGGGSSLRDYGRLEKVGAFLPDGLKEGRGRGLCMAFSNNQLWKMYEMVVMHCFVSQ